MCSVEFQSARVNLSSLAGSISTYTCACVEESLITAKSAQLSDKRECWGDKTCGRCVNYNNMIKSTTSIHSYTGKVLVLVILSCYIFK